MGIESDQLVLDYLSRVGDLAQQHQLSSGDRMRLVSELRSEIDQQRAKAAADSPGAVKRILGRLGTPDEVVRAAGGSAPAAERPEHRPVTDAGGGSGKGSGRGSGAGFGKRSGPGTGPAAAGGGAVGGAGQSGAGEDGGSGGTLRRLSAFARRSGLPLGGPVPSPRSGRDTAPAEPPLVPLVPLDGSVPPHLAGEDELSRGEGAPEWWRVEPGPFGTGSFGGGQFGPGESVPGFVGGIEIPEILKPPPVDVFGKEPPGRAGAGGRDGPERDGTDGTDAQDAADGRRGGALRALFRRRRAAAAERGGTASPLLLLAAALLVGGAFFGSLVALGAGWLIAWAGPRLTRVEAKWAAFALPGLVAAGALVWLWGRTDGRWGEPIAKGSMGAALTETWPVALRAAAVASALFLVWRARRRPRG